nr:hypothetical protein [Longispora sp. (in: high G+C Gram-positive bacteria)]
MERERDYGGWEQPGEIRKLHYTELPGEYNRLSTGFYSAADFRMERWFATDGSGAYFIGITRAILEPSYKKCIVNFYLGKPMLSNFLAMSEAYSNPFNGLDDAADGSSIAVIEPGEIPSLSYQETYVVWACLESFYLELVNILTDSASQGFPETYLQERITEAEKFIIATMDELVTAAQELSAPQD